MNGYDARLRPPIVSGVWQAPTIRLSRLSHTQRLTARGLALLGACAMLAAAVGATSGRPANRSEELSIALLDRADLGALETALDSAKIALSAAQQELDRARSLIEYSGRFNIAADLAAMIYDIASEEGIDPEVGFRLVYVESRFNHRAVSTAGAIGLAQVLPATAQYFVPDVKAEDLYDRELNLRIGFRYLKDLMAAFDGDLPLALIAYNRGPGRLRQLLAGGIPPWNGYASSVLNGYELRAPKSQ
jgi:soluble lytic murein transglycosylase-like protein